MFYEKIYREYHYNSTIKTLRYINAELFILNALQIDDNFVIEYDIIINTTGLKKKILSFFKDR